MKILATYSISSNSNEEKKVLVKHGDSLFSANAELAEIAYLTTADLAFVCRLPYKTIKAIKKWLSDGEFYFNYECYLGDTATDFKLV